MKVDKRPIGIFDSGIGGVTILNRCLEAFPNESFVYLGDTARLPYGTKSQTTIARYLTQNLAFFVMQDVKAVVVACNSASTVALETLTSSRFPVINVIEPGVVAALRAPKTRRVAVLATIATVRSQSYSRLLKTLSPELIVEEIACPLFVPLVEEGLITDPLTQLIVYRYLNSLIEKPLDALVLGCTHYPFLTPLIRKCLPSSVRIIDASQEIAHTIHSLFQSEEIFTSQKREKVHFFVTDHSETVEKLIDRFLRKDLIGAPFCLQQLDLER